MREHFRSPGQTRNCPWKGTPHYYAVAVGSVVNANAAWYYPEPMQAVKDIRGRVAFWRGVQVGG